MAIKFLDLHRQYLSIKDEIDDAIFKSIDTSSFIGGDEVRLFEKEFSEFLGENVQSLAVANGTDALEIAIEALNLQNDSEVLVPANTFVSTAEAVVRNGLKIVFVDCDDDYTIDIDDLKSKITQKTSAIIAVHLYGQSAKINQILELANEYSLKVIEDCAQSHGALYFNRKVGTFGDIATFSFYPGKNLGCFGDGGMIVSRDFYLLEKCRKIAHHGGLIKYQHDIVGRNSRLDTMQAAILRVKLKYLEGWNEKRRQIAHIYCASLKKTDFILPKVRSENECVWHLFVISCQNREHIIHLLKKNHIEYGLHYPAALPNVPAFRNQHYVRWTKTPKADMLQNTILSLPMGEHLSDEDVKKVIEVLLCGV